MQTHLVSYQIILFWSSYQLVFFLVHFRKIYVDVLKLLAYYILLIADTCAPKFPLLSLFAVLSAPPTAGLILGSLVPPKPPLIDTGSLDLLPVGLFMGCIPANGARVVVVTLLLRCGI